MLVENNIVVIDSALSGLMVSRIIKTARDDLVLERSITPDQIAVQHQRPLFTRVVRYDCCVITVSTMTSAVT